LVGLGVGWDGGDDALGVQDVDRGVVGHAVDIGPLHLLIKEHGVLDAIGVAEPGDVAHSNWAGGRLGLGVAVPGGGADHQHLDVFVLVISVNLVENLGILLAVG